MSAQSLLCKDCNLFLRSVKEAEVRGWAMVAGSLLDCQRVRALDLT